MSKATMETVIVEIFEDVYMLPNVKQMSVNTTINVNGVERRITGASFVNGVIYVRLEETNE